VYSVFGLRVETGGVVVSGAAYTATSPPLVVAARIGATPVSTLSPKTEYTLPRSFLAFDRYQDWLHVYLPTRPNDATGWIKASDVEMSQPLEYQIKVSLADHKLTLLHNGAVEFEVPAATGTDENPTPTGTFFFTDPLDLATQPGSAYGLFAIGLSGHSNTLSEFAGGDGQIAIHGTNDPSTIGQSVSHGCVRVNNDVILKLAKLPLGTPVVIT
jgi:lipoprotein-anchoring transpeptidase ErfK/SrfK